MYLRVNSPNFVNLVKSTVKLTPDACVMSDTYIHFPNYPFPVAIKHTNFMLNKCFYCGIARILIEFDRI